MYWSDFEAALALMVLAGMILLPFMAWNMRRDKRPTGFRGGSLDPDGGSSIFGIDDSNSVDCGSNGSDGGGCDGGGD